MPRALHDQRLKFGGRCAKGEENHSALLTRWGGKSRGSLWGKGKRPDLVGGGLLRSVGGWAELKEFRDIAVRKLGYKCTGVSKAMGVRAGTVSKAVSLGSELPEVDKIQTQMLKNRFRIIAVQRNQTGKIEKWNGRPSYPQDWRTETV